MKAGLSLLLLTAAVTSGELGLIVYALLWSAALVLWPEPY